MSEGKLSYEQLLELVITLHTALEAREYCHTCHGNGTVWQLIDGEAEPDPCDCSETAYVVLEDYKRFEPAIVDEYLRQHGIDPQEAADRFSDLAHGAILKAEKRWMNYRAGRDNE